MNKVTILLAGGALLRHPIAKSIPNMTFPWSVLLINAVGCYFIGLFWQASEITHFSTDMKIFIFVGLFGSFTTFSTYPLETVELVRTGTSFLALLNFVLNNLMGILMVLTGLISIKTVVFLARMISNLLTH